MIGDVNLLCSEATRPRRVPGGGRNGRLTAALLARRAGAVQRRAMVGPSPSTRIQRLPNLASQMRVAFSSMAWNTGSRSPGELEMTLQHLRGRRLLLQRLGQVVVRSAR